MDDFDIVAIPLDRVSRERLKRFAEACGLHPAVAAAQVLKDLLADDALYNAAEPESRSQSTH